VSDTKYVTLDELAAHVGVKVSTVRQWVKRGFVPRETYIKAGNTYRFCVEDVVAALRKEEPKGRYEAAVEKAADNLREGDERPERGTVTRAMIENVINEYEEETKSSEERDVEDMLAELDDDI
jgi:excisionase family DNA binding protein